MSQLTVANTSAPRVDALEKVTGRAKYVSDYKMPRMLYGKILRSPHAHARIIRIDTSEAERLPGVRAVVTGKDAPAKRVGARVKDLYILPRDNIVRAAGQAVAAVAAETMETAEKALQLIKVQYAELPAVFDPEEAMKEKPPVIVHPDFPDYDCDAMFKRYPFSKGPNICYQFKIRSGDTAKGFQQADLIVENRYSTARMHASPIEAHRADAWVEDDGTLCVRSSAQRVVSTAEELSRSFGLPPSKVRFISPYLGGGFGGKCGTFAQIDSIVAMLAMKSGRPVRVEFSREEEFLDSRQRMATVAYIKDGVKKDGTLVAREVKMILDVGRSADLTILLARTGSFQAVGTYRVPNFKLDSYAVYTNNPITGPFRGFGNPEVNWAIEQQMDILAGRLGISPVEIRKKNILREGEKDVCGQTVHSIGVEECLGKVVDWIELGKKPEPAGVWLTGKGFAISNKFTTGATSSTAIVKVHCDGAIEVRHGSDEMGQGINTVVAQIAAEEFGVPMDRVRVVRGDTAFCPYDYGAISSRCTFHTGNAVRLACQDAKRQLLQMAAPKLEAAVDSLEVKGGDVSVKGSSGKAVKITDLFNREGIPLKGGELLGTGTYTGRVIPEDPETGQSEKIVAYYAYGAHAAEVAVNKETGEVKVLGVAGAFDMGTPINPKMVEGQIEAGFGQGVGSTLYEQIVMEKGAVANPSFTDYKLPSAADMPPNHKAKSLLAPAPPRDGPFGAKGLGEGVLVPFAAAVANAVHQATGVRIQDLPISREKVLEALKRGKKDS